VFALNPLRNMFLVGATATVVILQLMAVYHPFLQRFLHTVPLAAHEWGYAAAIAASVLVLEEARKLIAFAFRKRREALAQG